MNLSQDTITFGKYKDGTLQQLLKDRKYCLWLQQQTWFQEQYSYLFEKVKEYNPSIYFLPAEMKLDSSSIFTFLNTYPYFYLTPTKELKISLTETEKTCYHFYKKCLKKLKEKIEAELCYDIKAPNGWLKEFEKKYGLSREMFKEFLASVDLPNITTIVEQIKAVGGIEYKGARSFLIAKERSINQEAFWEEILKEAYGIEIGTQFKFRTCIFDFIHINSNTVFECKLKLEDYNEEQHKKYMVTLGCYNMIYLIGQDCIVDMQQRKIYSLQPEKYVNYIVKLYTKKNISSLDEAIKTFDVIKIDSLQKHFTQK